MASVTNLEKKLVKLIEAEKPCAIALTGKWGVGKTHFWNNFYEKNHAKFKTKKYAYVSLFGIESLESLKFEIALKSHSTSQKKDNFSFFKKSFQQSLDVIDFSKLEGKGIALSLSKGMVSSAVSSMIIDTVICIDDIERHSAKLDIKDIMGLVNHLNLEKNCKVIVILHDAKASEQFQEYKEKVFDEVLILDDNLDILESFITDKLALDIMQLFYRTIKVKNLRFYNKVFASYQQIINSVDSLSKTSKEYILKNLLVIRWIDEFRPVIRLQDDENGKERTFKATLDIFRDENSDFISMSDDSFLKQSKDLKAFRKYIEPFYSLFSFDGWTTHIICMLTEHDISKESIQDLVADDILSETNLQNELFHRKVINEFHSLKIQPNFCERLYYSACIRIQKSELNNISFYCDIFENSDRKDLSKQIENHVKQFIKQEINSSQSKPSVGSWYRFGVEPHDRFHDFVVETVENYKANNISSNTISAIFLRYYEHSGWNDDKDILQLLDKDILKEVIWTEIDNEMYRKQFIHSILLHPIINEIEGKREEVRKWIIELLNEKMQESSGSEIPIRMWLKSTNDLTEGLS